VHCSLTTEKLEYARLNSTGETNAEYNFPRRGNGGEYCCLFGIWLRTKKVPQRHVSSSVVQQIHSILVWDFTLNQLVRMLCLGEIPRNAWRGRY